MYYRIALDNELNVKNKIFIPTMVHENPTKIISTTIPMQKGCHFGKFEKEKEKSLCFGKHIKRIPLAIASLNSGPFPEKVFVWETTEIPDKDYSNIQLADFCIVGEVRYYREIKAKLYGYINIGNNEWNRYSEIWKLIYNTELGKTNNKFICSELDLLNVHIHQFNY